jgi:hypothetical protein
VFEEKRMNQEVQLWERQTGEPTNAYRGFCLYRNLKPEERSIDAAWALWDASCRKTDSEGGAKSPRAPRTFFRWSSRFKWVKRAAAYDDKMERAERHARELARLKLVEERRDWEVEQFKFWTNLAKSLIQRYEAAANLPSTETRHIKRDEAGKMIEQTILKGVSSRELKSLIEAMALADSIATHGHGKVKATRDDTTNDGGAVAEREPPIIDFYLCARPNEDGPA